MSYKKGRRFEYKTKELFERLGFFVLRSAGSKSPVDLIAVRQCSADCEARKLFSCRQRGGVCVLGIQCKSDGKLTAIERAALLAVREYGMKPVFVSKTEITLVC